jgi:hypothetical protein
LDASLFQLPPWSQISIRFAVQYGNTWENWQHKPVQPSTATSTWLITREGCNYTQLQLGTAPRSRSGFFWVPPRI